MLDATTFAQHHPGGAGLILNYRSKDITQEMEAHYPLSLIMANTMVVGKFKKEDGGPKPKVENSKVYSVVVPCYMQEGVTIRPASVRVGVY